MLPLADFAADRIRRSPEWRCPSPSPTPTGDRHGRCRSPRLSVTTHKVCNVGGVSPSCHRRTAWLCTSRNSPVIYRFWLRALLDQPQLPPSKLMAGVTSVRCGWVRVSGRGFSPSCRRRSSWPGSPPFGRGWVRVSGGGFSPSCRRRSSWPGSPPFGRLGAGVGGGVQPQLPPSKLMAGVTSVRCGWVRVSGGGFSPSCRRRDARRSPPHHSGRGSGNGMGVVWYSLRTPPLSGRRSRREREEEEAYATSPPRTVELSLDLRPFGGTPPSGATLRKLGQKAATERFVNSPQVMETTGSGDQRR